MRGGPRENSGRKPIDPSKRRVELSVKIDPSTSDILKKESKEMNISRGRIIDRLVNTYSSSIKQ